MSDLLASLAFRTAMIAFVFNIAIALYGVLSRPSLVKKFLCLVAFTDSINIFAVFIGFRYTPGAYPSPPILEAIPTSPAEVETLINTSVDPLPQAMILTAIVIGIACSMFLLTLILMYYRHYGTTNIHEAEEGEEPHAEAL